MRKLKALFLCLAFVCLVDPAHADVTFEIHNKSKAIVAMVYFNPSNYKDWGPERMGLGLIGPGYYRQWNIPSNWGCYIDVRAETFGTKYWERYGLNICENNAWFLYN